MPPAQVLLLCIPLAVASRVADWGHVGMLRHAYTYVEIPQFKML